MIDYPVADIDKINYFKSRGIKSGIIYKLEAPDGSVYIGQTAVDIKVRLRKYNATSKKMKNGQKRIYNSINKHGWDSFKKDILGYYSCDLLNEAEIFWIDYYNSYAKNNKEKGLNLTHGGRNVFFRKEYKKYERNADTTKSCLSVEVYDVNKCFVKSFGKIIDAVSFIGSNRSAVSRCMKDKHIDSRGEYYVIYKGENVLDYATSSIGDKVTTSKDVYMYRVDGSFVKGYKSRSSCAKDIDVGLNSIMDCVSGKIKSCNGYTFRDYKVDNIAPIYVKGRNPIFMYSKDGVFIKRFKNCAEAYRELGISPSSIFRYLLDDNLGDRNYILRRNNEQSNK